MNGWGGRPFQIKFCASCSFSAATCFSGTDILVFENLYNSGPLFRKTINIMNAIIARRYSPLSVLQKVLTIAYDLTVTSPVSGVIGSRWSLALLESAATAVVENLSHQGREQKSNNVFCMSELLNCSHY